MILLAPKQVRLIFIGVLWTAWKFLPRNGTVKHRFLFLADTVNCINGSLDIRQLLSWRTNSSVTYSWSCQLQNRHITRPTAQPLLKVVDGRPGLTAASVTLNCPTLCNAIYVYQYTWKYYRSLISRPTAHLPVEAFIRYADSSSANSKVVGCCDMGLNICNTR